ncbi:MAG: TldD/PmbA family protein [Actinomycetota bacterium]|nr:TldD/PmbA family protein [Actinomycetota bacterium]
MTDVKFDGGEELLVVCDRVLELVGDRAEAEVTVRSGRSGLTRFANSHIHQNVAESGRWARLKVIVNGRQATAGTSRLTAGLESLVERALRAADLRPVDPGWPGLAPPASAGSGPDERYDEVTFLAEPDLRAEIVHAFVEEGDGLEAAGFCETGGSVHAFANSAGQRVWFPWSRAVIEGIHRSPGSDGSGQQISARVDRLDGSAAGRAAAEKARRGEDALELEPGSYEVILEPAAVVDMLDFLTGHGFNAKHHAEGRSFVELGRAQFDPQVSIFDDPTDPRSLGYPFDAEGTPCRLLDLVRSGVSVALAHDRRTAAAVGTGSTGHAVVGGEISGPVPTSVFLQPGDRSPASMIAAVDRGLLVTEFWYTRILDPKTQVVTGLTRNGLFLIEDGKVTSGVRNLRFTQSYVEALAAGNVLGVGNDGRLAGESQFFAPTVHLRSWNFTGGARG